MHKYLIYNDRNRRRAEIGPRGKGETLPCCRGADPALTVCQRAGRFLSLNDPAASLGAYLETRRALGAEAESPSPETPSSRPLPGSHNKMAAAVPPPRLLVAPLDKGPFLTIADDRDPLDSDAPRHQVVPDCLGAKIS